MVVIFLRFFPLPEDFLTVKETVKENVPVDADSGIHKLRLLLKFSCNWCALRESSMPSKCTTFQLNFSNTHSLCITDSVSTGTNSFTVSFTVKKSSGNGLM